MNILQISIPPLPRFAATARKALKNFGGVNAVAAPDLENLVFALGEAIANAIQHAHTSEAIEIRADAGGDSIVVTVTDRGRGIPVLPDGPVSFPSIFAEGGRGFAIMQRCTDVLDVTSTPGTGTVVTLVRHRRACQELGTAS
jgi:stage II sporulation protein AB (anti-sigma F factor)